MARTPKYDEPTKRTHIFLPQSLWDQLGTVAEQEQTSISMLLVTAAKAKYSTRTVGSILTDLGDLYSELNERLKQDEAASPLVTTRAARAAGQEALQAIQQAIEATKQLQTSTN